MKKILIALLVPLLLGCAGRYSRAGEEQPEIAVMRGTVPSNYVNLGIVTASDLMCNLNDLLKELKEKAGKLGATAIYIEDKIVLTDCNHNLIAMAARPGGE